MSTGVLSSHRTLFPILIRLRHGHQFYYCYYNYYSVFLIELHYIVILTNLFFDNFYYPVSVREGGVGNCGLQVLIRIKIQHNTRNVQTLCLEVSDKGVVRCRRKR